MELISTHLVKTSDIGLNDNLFGGRMLSWLDEDGASFASSYCEATRLVTVKFNETNFKKPAKKGMLIKVYGSVKRVGTSSITIELEARAYNVENGSEKIVCDTGVVYVKVDQSGESTPISDKVREKFNSK